MKTLLKLVLVSALFFASGLLKAEPSDDSTKYFIGEPVIVDDTNSNSKGNEITEKANKTLLNSVIALDNLMGDSDNAIPPILISQSDGIVIFPAAFKLALGAAGGQGARGVAMVRRVDGTWSNPFFVSLGEGSLGFQIGAQKSEIVLLFKDREDLLAIDKVEVTLGGDVGVAAGPAFHGSSATTDFKFDSEIYSYSRSKGLFAGVSLKGGVLTFNNSVNESLYCMEDIDSDDILYDFPTPYNDKVFDLIEALNMYGE